MKDDNRQERATLQRIEPLSSDNFATVCEDAVSSFLNGDITKFGETQKRLETYRIGTVRSLLNREQAKLMETQGDEFNQKFNLVNNGDFEEEDEEEKDGEYAPQIVDDVGRANIAQAGTSIQDYLAE